MSKKATITWVHCILIAGLIQGLIESGIIKRGVIGVVSPIILTYGIALFMGAKADQISREGSNWKIKHTLTIIIGLIISSTITTGLAASICYLVAINHCSQELWSLFIVNLLVCVVPPMIRLLPQLEKSVNDENKLK